MLADTYDMSSAAVVQLPRRISSRRMTCTGSARFAVDAGDARTGDLDADRLGQRLGLARASVDWPHPASQTRAIASGRLFLRAAWRIEPPGDDQRFHGVPTST